MVVPTSFSPADLQSLADRFWAKVERSDDCWTWTSSLHRDGYGIFWLPRRRGLPRQTVFAHRFAWTLVRGPIPARLLVLHRCDNPPCVRLDHLFLGTQADNVADMDAKGRRRWRNNQGERHELARLSNAEVAEIRFLHAAGARQKDLAERFYTSRSNVCIIVNGKARRAG